MSDPARQRPSVSQAPVDGPASSVRTSTPDGASSAAASGGTGEAGGINDYLASLSSLGLAPSIDGPGRLTAAEVRRHTTGRMRAIPDTNDPPRRPTTQGMRAVSDRRSPSRTATGGTRAIPDASRRGTPRRFLLPAFAVVLACAAFLPRVFTPAPSAELPIGMVGEWSTSHPQYASRRLVFTRTDVGIAVSATRAPALHRVTEVQASGRGDTLRVEITYEQDGEPVRFQVQYTTTPRRRVVLANPPDVMWYPVSEQPVASPSLAPASGDSVLLPDANRSAR